MTDFVNRLLGRAETPAIRPLVPSLFEPVPVVGAERPLPMGEVTASDPAVPDPPVTGPTRVTVTTPAAHRRADAESGPVPARAERASTEPDIPAAAYFAPRTPDPVDPAPIPTALVARPVNGTAAAPAGSEEIPATVVVESVTVPTSPAGPAPEPVPRPRRSSPVSPQARVGPQETVEPSVRAHPVWPAATRIPPASPAGPPVPVVPRRAQASEPAVHISIGRVEVRAAVEPAKPKREERNEQRVLSLDEYLRERAAGERG